MALAPPLSSYRSWRLPRLQPPQRRRRWRRPRPHLPGPPRRRCPPRPVTPPRSPPPPLPRPLRPPRLSHPPPPRPRLHFPARPRCCWRACFCGRLCCSWGWASPPARSRGSRCPAPTEAAPRRAGAAVESAGPAALLRRPPRRAARAAPSRPPRPLRLPGAGAGGHARPPEARSRASATGPRAERDAREPEGKGGSRACFDSAALTRLRPASARDDTGARARPRPLGDLTAGRSAPVTSRPTHCPPPR